MPPKRSIKALWSELDKLCQEAETIALQTTLLIPEYAFNTLPLICFQATDMTEPFEFQFQLWFDPEAHQAQWCHIQGCPRVDPQMIRNLGHLQTRYVGLWRKIQ